MHQPDKVVNPARIHLNTKNELSLSPFAPEKLVSQDGFGRPVARLAFSTLRLKLVLTLGIPPASREGVYLLIPSTAIGSVPSL